jgi:hypothetical protein
MADKNWQCRNIDNIEVKVFGEKKGRYDLKNLPKLKYKKKDKHRQKREPRATGTFSSAEVDVNEPVKPELHYDTATDLGQNIGDHETSSAFNKVVMYTKYHK